MHLSSSVVRRAGLSQFTTTSTLVLGGEGRSVSIGAPAIAETCKRAQQLAAMWHTQNT